MTYTVKTQWGYMVYVNGKQVGAAVGLPNPYPNKPCYKLPKSLR